MTVVQKKNARHNGSVFVRSAFCFVILFVLVVFHIISVEESSSVSLADLSVYDYSDTSSSSSSNTVDVGAITKNNDEEEDSVSIADILDRYDTCELEESGPPPNKGDTRKPLWLASFPNALNDGIIKGIASKLTGYGNPAARSFYARSDHFKQCFGKGQTALCLVVHPLVEMNPPPTAYEFTNKFHSNVIYAIRNPMTNIPAFYNGKQEKYHGLEGQVPENEWRQFRDQYLEGLIQQWKDQLRTWKTMTKEDDRYYKLRMYLPYEKLLSVGDGVRMVQRLMDTLQMSNIDIIVEDDMDTFACVWYLGIGKELITNYFQYGYEYTNYIPGYTVPQKKLLLTEILSFIEEMRDDTQLVSILKSYYHDIEANIRIDRPYVHINGD